MAIDKNLSKYNSAKKKSGAKRVAKSGLDNIKIGPSKRLRIHDCRQEHRKQSRQNYKSKGNDKRQCDLANQVANYKNNLLKQSSSSAMKEASPIIINFVVSQSGQVDIFVKTKKSESEEPSVKDQVQVATSTKVPVLVSTPTNAPVVIQSNTNKKGTSGILSATVVKTGPKPLHLKAGTNSEKVDKKGHYCVKPDDERDKAKLRLHDKYDRLRIPGASKFTKIAHVKKKIKKIKGHHDHEEENKEKDADDKGEDDQGQPEDDQGQPENGQEAENEGDQQAEPGSDTGDEDQKTEKVETTEDQGDSTKSAK